MGIDEIKEAYRMWAAGEIQVKGAEMYGGAFNVAQLGKILTAYTTERRKVIAQYTKLKKEQEEAQVTELRAQRMKDQYEANFFKLIVAAKAKYQDFREFFLHWYDTLLKKEMILPVEEMNPQDFVECYQKASLDLSEEWQESKSIFKQVGQKKEQRVEDRAKVYAQKKLLFDFIQNYNP